MEGGISVVWRVEGGMSVGWGECSDKCSAFLFCSPCAFYGLLPSVINHFLLSTEQMSQLSVLRLDLNRLTALPDAIRG